MKKFFRYTIITLFFGFFITGAILQTKAVREYVKEYLIHKIKEETGYNVEIADVKLFPSFQFSAYDITIYEKEKKIADISHIYLGFYPLDFRKGYLHFHTLFLEGVNFHTPAGTNDPTPSISTQDFPFKLRMDSFQLNDLSIIDNNGEVIIPFVSARGSFYLSPKDSLLVIGIKATPSNDPENWISTEIAYDNGEGSIQINTVDNIDFDAEFVISNDNLLRIKRFHTQYNSNTVDGNATLTYDGVFIDSSLLFSSGKLSEKIPIHGTLYGEGKIVGSIWSPEIDLILNSDQLMFNDTIFHDLKATVHSRLEDKGLGGGISVSFLKDNLPYQFSGQIFWEETLGPLPTRFKAKTNLAELAQILNIDATEISGNVDVELKFSDNDIKGEAIITNGFLESYQLGSVITDIEAVIEGNLKRLKLKKFKAQDGAKGTYSAKGSLEFNVSKHFPFEFALNINKVQLLQLDNAKATASGQLKLHGNLKNSLLEGILTADSSRLTIPDRVSAVTDSLEITYINQAAGERAPTPSNVKRPEIPLELNVKINVPGNTKIKGKAFASEWEGNATITGTPMTPKVNGELTVTSGKYRVRGRNLEINKGSITFAGDLEKKTTLYVIGEMAIDRYTIEVIAKGPIKNPTFSFRSNPPLSRKEILSWILFNKDISNISEFQGGKLNQSITTLSTGTDDGPDILTRFSDTLGIDRVDITGSPDASQVSIELGKYVSESTYISISRKPSREIDSKRVGTGTLDPDEYDQTNRIGIETSLGRDFKLQAEVDDDQSGQINLLWKKDY